MGYDLPLQVASHQNKAHNGAYRSQQNEYDSHLRLLTIDHPQQPRPSFFLLLVCLYSQTKDEAQLSQRNSKMSLQVTSNVF